MHPSRQSVPVRSFHLKFKYLCQIDMRYLVHLSNSIFIDRVQLLRLTDKSTETLPRQMTNDLKERLSIVCLWKEGRIQFPQSSQHRCHDSFDGKGVSSKRKKKKKDHVTAALPCFGRNSSQKNKQKPECSDDKLDFVETIFTRKRLNQRKR